MEQINDLANFNGKKVLVLGGMGFIGSNFIRNLFNASPDVQVICFDAQTYSGNPANLNEVRDNIKNKYIEIKGDIANAEDLVLAFACEPDYVINFAAETHVDRSIHVGSIEFINTNVIGVYNILEAVKKCPSVKKYLQVSTDEVYGQLENPYDKLKEMRECKGDGCEDKLNYLHYHSGGLVQNGHQVFSSTFEKKFNRLSPFKPNVPYSATKASGDCLCNAYHHTWHVPVVVTHCSNNYGPYQYPEKMLPYWATRLLKGEKIPIYGDGFNIRDWIHVDDHVTALCAVLLRGETGKDYLIGADNERTNLEMAQLIIEVIKGNVNWKDYIEFVEDRPGHDRRYAIDHSDITAELGWVPKYGKNEFLGKLRETLEWYSNHSEWSEEIIKRTGVANAHIDLWSAHNIKNEKN